MSETPNPTGWRRRLISRGLLLGAVVAVVALLWPAIPREQVLWLRVGAGARRVELSLTQEGERIPRSTVGLVFPEGSTEKVRHVVSAPNGRYLVEVTVERGSSGAPSETSYLRRVTLEGSEIVLLLEGQE